MSKVIPIHDPLTGNLLRLSVKGFLRGALVGDKPIVALVVTSKQGELIGHFQIEPEDGLTFSEYIRQEAELASVAQEDNL